MSGEVSVTIRERVVYLMDKMLSGTDSGRLFFLALLYGVLVGVLGGFRYAFSTESLATAVVWAAATTLSPSFGNEETPLLVALAAVTSVLGLCVVAVLIGLVNASIEQRLEVLRRGRSRVIISRHLIILGFVPEKVKAILSELATATRERSQRGHLSASDKLQVVVLSEMDTQIVYETIQSRQVSAHLDVIVRCGNPCSVSQLLNVGADRAASVIILNTESDSDIVVVKTLLALRKMPHPAFHVVCELNKPETKSILPSIFPGPLAPIVLGDTLARILVQTSRSAGLSEVFGDLLTFEGSELYFVAIEELTGLEFGKVQASLYDAVAVGFERDKHVRINPPSDEVLRSGDLILVLSASGTSYRVGAPRSPSKPTLRNSYTRKDVRKRETICILGSNQRSLEFILREFDEYMLEGSTILMLPSGPYTVPEDLLNVKVQVLQGSCTDPNALKKIPFEDLSSCIIMSSDLLSYTDSDAQTITTVLLLRQLTEKMQRPCPLICEILNVESRDLLDQSLGVSFVLSNEITSRLISQVSLDLGLCDVFQELFSPEGCEIYLKRHEFYTDGSKTWLDIQSRAQSINEVAIGFFTSKGPVLNPAQDLERVFEPGDKVIVISEDETQMVSQ